MTTNAKSFQGLLLDHFAVQLNKVRVATVQEISGFALRQRVVTVRQLNSRGQIMEYNQPAGKELTGEITLSRVMDMSKDLLMWLEDSMDFKDVRQTATITMFTPQRKEAHKFHLANALPVQWSMSPLSATSAGAPAVESITIRYDQMVVDRSK
ncbi:phage tail protein [Streptomyces sp. NPDC049577]|uniref:phage tail protein n=1 Tax=Streptomyces sp. NPDC049577 TaxID=3155153 RepID=UPI00344AD539